MNFFRLIFFFVFVYLGYKIITFLLQFIFPKSVNKTGPEVRLKKESAKLDIKKEDIIEADFEEIKSRNSETDNK